MRIALFSMLNFWCSFAVEVFFHHILHFVLEIWKSSWLQMHILEGITGWMCSNILYASSNMFSVPLYGKFYGNFSAFGHRIFLYPRPLSAQTWMLRGVNMVTLPAKIISGISKLLEMGHFTDYQSIIREHWWIIDLTPSILYGSYLARGSLIIQFIWYQPYFLSIHWVWKRYLVMNI